MKKIQKEFTLSLSKGFTLIELLIVIAILGVLAAAVVVAINPTRRINQAKDTKIKNDIDQISSALQAYYTTSATYPTALAGLVTSEDLKAVPVPPAGGSAGYDYLVLPAGCLGTVASPCTSVSVSEPLLAPAAAGNLWCFRSSQGSSSEVTAAAACPAS